VTGLPVPFTSEKFLTCTVTVTIPAPMPPSNSGEVMNTDAGFGAGFSLIQGGVVAAVPGT
jgi:hypothetical protein